MPVGISRYRYVALCFHSQTELAVEQTQSAPARYSRTLLQHSSSICSDTLGSCGPSFGKRAKRAHGAEMRILCSKIVKGLHMTELLARSHDAGALHPI